MVISYNIVVNKRKRKKKKKKTSQGLKLKQVVVIAKNDTVVPNSS